MSPLSLSSRLVQEDPSILTSNCWTPWVCAAGRLWLYSAVSLQSAAWGCWEWQWAQITGCTWRRVSLCPWIRALTSRLHCILACGESAFWPVSNVHMVHKWCEDLRWIPLHWSSSTVSHEWIRSLALIMAAELAASLWKMSFLWLWLQKRAGLVVLTCRWSSSHTQWHSQLLHQRVWKQKERLRQEVIEDALKKNYRKWVMLLLHIIKQVNSLLQHNNAHKHIHT